MFSLRDDSSIVKLKYVKNKEVDWDKKYMGIFGYGHDIVIKDNCNVSDNSSDLGNSRSSFETPNVQQPDAYLAGSFDFKVCEYEVFRLIWEIWFDKVIKNKLTI